MMRCRPPLPMDLAPEVGECGPEPILESPIPDLAIAFALLCFFYSGAVCKVDDRGAANTMNRSDVDSASLPALGLVFNLND
jgi:hypothetical protein